MSRTLALTVSILCGIAAAVSGQQPARFRDGASQLHELKNAFVSALREFAESTSGSYGDEGPRLRSDLDALEQTLLAWDAAIDNYAATLQTLEHTADVHAALGVVYLDRLRVQDALREFDAAARLEPGRADVHEIAAAAYDFADDAPRAVTALEKARERADDDLATLYQLSARYRDTGRPGKALEVETRVAALALGRPAAGVPAAQAFARAGLLRQVAGVAPIFPPQMYAAGFQLLERGQLADGLSALRSAVAKDPLTASGAASPAASAGTRLRHGQLQAAFTALRLSAAPPDAETQRIAGIAYWADEQYDKSIMSLTAAIDLNPSDERARIALADVFVAAGDTPAAERTLREAIAAMPASGQAHYRLGRLYQRQSNTAEAIDQYERAVASAPLIGLDNLFDVIGGLYATQADFDHAALAYRRRVDVNPNYGDAHRKLGEIYALRGVDEAALAEFAIARWLNPRDADASAECAQICLRLDRFAEAARLSREALSLDQSQQKARFVLGTALTRLGDAEGGHRELETFQRQFDDAAARRRRALDVDARVAEATRMSTAGNYSQAAESFQRALDGAPDNLDVEIQLATALEKAGKPGDALAHLTRARTLRPNDAEIHKLAADAYAALGQPDDRQREEALYRSLAEQRKEDRVKQRPLLR
jgi:tetratricopeptide (TPR) repeat protein